MKILICLDGTSNQPRDAEQDIDENNLPEDDNITNVLKLHCLAGGDLTVDDPVRDSGGIDGQLSLYFSGVGTRGSFLRRILRQAFALRGPRVIIDEILRDLESVYEPGDELYVFGFSRGAATARLLATEIAAEGLKTRSGDVDPAPVIAMLGVWDTVASFNKPEIERDDPLPSGEEIGERGRIAPIIEEAYHLVSLDEQRLAFRPTLMNVEDRVREIWFAGVHSDVGGGFHEDGLSDITLEFMLGAARGRGLEFFRDDELPEEFVGVDQRGEEVRIGRDDLEIRPDILGVLHQPDRSRLKERLTAPRQCTALRGDRPSDVDLPVIHHSVPERIRNRRDYRPRSLEDTAHRVLEAGGGLRTVSGLSDHLPT